MSEIVVVSGNPRPGSRTRQLASTLGDAIAGQRGATTPEVIDVAELGAGLLTPGDEPTRAAVAAVQAAKVLVVATPTYKGSYTGVLKVLFDQLPANALVGVFAVPVATAGVQPQADAAVADLRRLLGELGAGVPEAGLAVAEADLPDAPQLVARYAAALRW